MSRNPELTLIPEMSLMLDDVIKTRLLSKTSSATLIQCHNINERKCSTDKSEYNVTKDPMDAVSTIQDAVSTIQDAVSIIQYKILDDFLTMKTFIASCLFISLAEFSLQGYAPPVVRTAAPEPVCGKVPKKVCEEVPRTVYDTISRRECHDFADIVCADIQEQKCPVSQKPVQETVSHQQCSSQSSGPFLTFITNLLRCQGDLTKMTLSHEMPREPPDDLVSPLSQASAVIPKCRSANERKCSDQQSLVKRRQCQDVADTERANTNKKKCQISQMLIVIKIKINERLK